MDKTFQEEFTQIIKFEPPLYKQRHQFVKDLVEKYKPKKVADLGCADCSLLWMLKFCSCIEVLAGLDICANVMKEKMHTLSPLPVDYLQPSERSLTVTLHHGSVAHKDPCMLGFDLVTCIELIEHLDESELKKFPEVVFGFMAPSIVVISTPNSEFNPLLSRVMSYRHPDHKFEWSQAQFRNWALEAARCYGYSVEFTGVGHPPTGMEKVGFCTQIGVFLRKYPQTGELVQSEKPTETVYKTLLFKTVKSKENTWKKINKNKTPQHNLKNPPTSKKECRILNCMNQNSLHAKNICNSVLDGIHGGLNSSFSFFNSLD
ncbi:small RNA 2'-O-methyltransferase isoform X5 [Cyanistes caeruleus]|uniref:small RNA 2'-O-methyltransferase isoform X5 n=1 Tax=Cyanistes caeruleus TaxID=156563 RepID=UPI000CDA7545|nr:small RNA 2'-O-methyltransferase isoform X5 [Cyanistes caeruleus]